MTAAPKPGDLVLVDATDDVFIPVGAYGVIIGVVGETTQEPLKIVFNFTNPWWQKTGQGAQIVNASGGPQRGISTEQLKPMRQQIQEFLNFDGPWAEDAAKSKTIKVNVWKINLTKH